jgi:hypothetical protein
MGGCATSASRPVRMATIILRLLTRPELDRRANEKRLISCEGFSSPVVALDYIVKDRYKYCS